MLFSITKDSLIGSWFCLRQLQKWNSVKIEWYLVDTKVVYKS